MAVLRGFSGSIARISTAGFIFAIVLLLLLLPALAVSETTEAEGISSEAVAEPATKNDRKCMKCHSKDKTKSLEDGDEMSLNIPLTEYTSSAHSEEGCVSCHKVIANKKHPSKKYRISINSQRDYSVEKNEVCRDCHEDEYSLYVGGIHASMITHGNRKAPVCSDCHSAHAVEPMAVYDPTTGLPCKKCHEDIYNAYSLSVHGEARKNGNTIREEHIQAPICMDCHHAHNISALASKTQIISLCLDCHKDAELAHKEWLPNASQHLEVVACAACHAPGVERRVDLELYDSLVQDGGNESDQSTAHVSAQQQLSSLDAEGRPVNYAEFSSLVNGNSKDGKNSDMKLYGRMETVSGVDAHRLADKSLAARDCDSCHQKGVEVFQNITVSIASPDGRRLHYEADKELLDSLGSVESVNDFYTIGGTRIPLLDLLVVLSLFAGIALPIGHMSLGWIIKRKVAKEKNNA